MDCPLKETWGLDFPLTGRGTGNSSLVLSSGLMVGLLDPILIDEEPEDSAFCVCL